MLAYCTSADPTRAKRCTAIRRRCHWPTNSHVSPGRSGITNAISMATTSCVLPHELNNNANRRTASHTSTARSVTESLAERSVRRRGKADNEADPRVPLQRVASRRAKSKMARSARTPHMRPDIRLQPIHSARTRNARTLTLNGDESIYAHVRHRSRTAASTTLNAGTDRQPELTNAGERRSRDGPSQSARRASPGA
jgi:hypothetical protein